MEIYQEENFFNDINYILPQIYKIPLYNKKDFNEKFHKNAPGQNWPGFRSEDLTKSNPIFASYVLNLLLQTTMFKNKRFDFNMYTHLRLPDNEPAEFIHTDDNDSYVGLVYLNESNLSSGTAIFDDMDRQVNDFKYVQNRLIAFNGAYKHRGYGYFGDSKENGRLTLNLFFHLR